MKRRWFQFSLSTAVICIIACAIALFGVIQLYKTISDPAESFILVENGLDRPITDCELNVAGQALTKGVLESGAKITMISTTQDPKVSFVYKDKGETKKFVEPYVDLWTGESFRFRLTEEGVKGERTRITPP
ncbi:MAG TPA: hypothetical protein VEK08_25780 [Planctomycetota bacterium]|nr:hypothetical protein [Planctomycetota bacterium]